MNRTVGIALFSFAILAGCSPYTFSEPEEITQDLIGVVPIGTTVAEFEGIARDKGWQVRSIAQHPVGPTYFDDHDTHCVLENDGEVAAVIVSEYWSPFLTVIETQWLFEEDAGLVDVCVRRTVDAL